MSKNKVILTIKYKEVSPLECGGTFRGVKWLKLKDNPYLMDGIMIESFDLSMHVSDEKEMCHVEDALNSISIALRGGHQILKQRDEEEADNICVV
jgi:hypothetical protein